jgi:WD40 repeat protein
VKTSGNLLLSHHYTKPDPPSKLSSQSLFHNAPVLGVKFYSASPLFLTCSADKSARTYDWIISNFNRYTSGREIKFSKSFTCKSPVSGVDLGLASLPGLGIPFITTESNRFCKLWTTERSDPLLELEPSSYSCFFYKDALIVQARGSKLDFSKYSIEKPDPASIQPALSSLYNKVKKISSNDALSDSASSICAIGCVNSTQSELILVAGKNKSLCILDVNQGTSIKRIPDAMKRPIHKICVPDSYTVSNFSNSNLFATAAICDSVKIWDMRKQVCPTFI